MYEELSEESVGREGGSFEESRKEEAANAPQESTELKPAGEETAAGDEKSQPEKSELTGQDGGQTAADGPSASPEKGPAKKKAGRPPKKKPAKKKSTPRKPPAKKPAKKKSTRRKPPASPDTPMPSVDGKSRNLKSCSPEQLGEAVNAEHLLIVEFGKKTAIHTFRLGRLLTVAKEKVKAGEWAGGTTWAAFLKRYGISIATDNRARQLYQRAGSERAVAGYTITEAYDEFGIKTRGNDKSGEEDDAKKKSRGKSEQDEPTDAPPPKEPIHTFEYGLATVVPFVEGLLDKAAFKPPKASEKNECLNRLAHLEAVIKQIRQLLEEEGSTDASS